MSILWEVNHKLYIFYMTQGACQTTHGELVNAAAGNGKRRTRNLPSPHVEFAIAAACVWKYQRLCNKLFNAKWLENA